MKIQKTKLGFTLIELMVVITIIGILATGAVSVYTSQIQKARDSNRVTGIKALQTSVEQAYSDLSEYPGVTTSTAKASSTTANCSDFSKYNMQCLVTFGYISELPSDPKTGSTGNGTPLEIAYNIKDQSGVNNQVFELSTGFEAAGSVASKANNSVDKGGDANRMEIGNDLTIVTRLVGATAQTTEGNSTPDTLSATQASCKQVDASNADNKPIIIKGNCG